MNTRLRAAMVAARFDVETVSHAVGVDPRTVQRWLGGRVPHARHRWAVAKLLDEDDHVLWPSVGADRTLGADATGEVVAAYGHRADVPVNAWANLINGARRQIDLLGYAHLFLPEQHVDLTSRITTACSAGCKVRIIFADPDGQGVRERDSLERLDGTLPARIRMSMAYFRDLSDLDGVEIRFHDLHLYHAIYRFDDEMIMTPYLIGAHGPQHPALQLRRRGSTGIFASLADELDMVWHQATRSCPPDVVT